MADGSSGKGLWFVYGRHIWKNGKLGKKEYVWFLSRKLTAAHVVPKAGDRVVCETQLGPRDVLVTRCERMPDLTFARLRAIIRTVPATEPSRAVVRVQRQGEKKAQKH